VRRVTRSSVLIVSACSRLSETAMRSGSAEARAGRVHGVGTAQGMSASELNGVAFDVCVELDRADGGPVWYPVILLAGWTSFRPSR
jgi:hypothetical protein